MLCIQNQYSIKQDYLANHKYITSSNRSVVVDWLVEVQQEFQIMQESLYTAVGILDRYLQVIIYVFYYLNLIICFLIKKTSP